MRPLGSNVIIKRASAEDSKIILLDAPVRPNTGTVVGLGPDVQGLHLNDVVMFSDTFTAKEIPGDEDLLVIGLDNVLVVL